MNKKIVYLDMSSKKGIEEAEKKLGKLSPDLYVLNSLASFHEIKKVRLVFNPEDIINPEQTEMVEQLAGITTFFVNDGSILPCWHKDYDEHYKFYYDPEDELVKICVKLKSKYKQYNIMDILISSNKTDEEKVALSRYMLKL